MREKRETIFTFVLLGSFTLEIPKPGEAAEVMVVVTRFSAMRNQGTAELPVGAAYEPTVGPVDVVALVARGEQTGAAGDRLRVGVVGQRAHLGCQVPRRRRR